MNKAELVFEKVAKERKKGRSFMDAVTGAAAGSVATAITKPLENIEYATANPAGKYFKKPWLDVAKGLYKDKGLWAGTGSKLIKVAPTMGITFAVYELLKNKLT